MIVAAFVAFAVLVVAWMALPSPTIGETIDYPESASEEATVAA